jgi:hypothetical protein
MSTPLRYLSRLSEKFLEYELSNTTEDRLVRVFLCVRHDQRGVLEYTLLKNAVMVGGGGGSAVDIAG